MIKDDPKGLYLDPDIYKRGWYVDPQYPSNLTIDQRKKLIKDPKDVKTNW